MEDCFINVICKYNLDVRWERYEWIDSEIDGDGLRVPLVLVIYRYVGLGGLGNDSRHTGCIHL